jgi:ribosomal protein S17E
LAVSARAGKYYEESMKLRNDVATYMTPEELKKAKQMIREWEAKHPKSELACDW